MTRDDIRRMAREAGIFWFDYGSNDGDANMLEKFAALVAAAEREACAKVAESYEPTCDTCPSGVAAAIRARGTKQNEPLAAQKIENTREAD